MVEISEASHLMVVRMDLVTQEVTPTVMMVAAEEDAEAIVAEAVIDLIAYAETRNTSFYRIASYDDPSFYRKTLERSSPYGNRVQNQICGTG